MSEQSESNNAIAVRLAAALNANRITLRRYLEAGMPHDEAGAREWILAFRTNKSKTRATKAPATIYPVVEVKGDDSAARMQRLKDTEKSLAGEIAGIEREVLPSLAAQLHATTGEKKRDVERQLFQAQSTLLSLRKENRAYQKMISEIELKTLAAREGLVSVEHVKDCQVKCFMPLFSFLRSIDVDGEERTIAKELTRRYTETLDNYVSALSKEPRHDN